MPIGAPNPLYQYPNVNNPTTWNRIALRTKGWEDERVQSGYAASNIIPGMLLALEADGGVIPHPVAGGAAQKMFAIEDAWQGNTIAQAYSAGALVFSYIFLGGDLVYALVASGASTIAEGQGLTSDGAGGLKLATGANVIIAVANQALASPTAQTWIEAIIY
jgi:hypothetical protein